MVFVPFLGLSSTGNKPCQAGEYAVPTPNHAHHAWNLRCIASLVTLTDTHILVGTDENALVHASIAANTLAIKNVAKGTAFDLLAIVHILARHISRLAALVIQHQEAAAVT
jgi:hypothetical protein